MPRWLACLIFLVLAPALLAQDKAEERPVVIDLQDGTHIEGRLVDFGQRAYHVRIADKVVEIPEGAVSEIRFQKPSESATTVAEALKVLEQEIEADPSQANDALKRFRHALGLDEPRHEDAFRNFVRAQSMFAAGMRPRAEFDAAIRDFEQALALDPGRTHAVTQALSLAQKAADDVRARAEALAAAEEKARPRGVFWLQCEAPEMVAQVVVGPDGRAIAPYRDSPLQVEGVANEILAAEIERGYRALGLAAGVLQKLSVDGPTSSGRDLESEPLPSGAVLRVEVEGHPEWAFEFQPTSAESILHPVDRLGKIELRKDSTWGSILSDTRQLVEQRDRNRTIWLRRLPTPPLPRVSMIAIFNEIVTSLSNEDLTSGLGSNLALSEDRIRLGRAIGSLADLSRFEAALNRSGRLRATLREAVPSKDPGGNRAYQAMIEASLQDAAVPAWVEEERRRREGDPEAAFQVGALLARLEEIAAKHQLELGTVQGNERKIGGMLSVVLTGPTPVALRDGLRALEGIARNSSATDLELVCVNKVNGQVTTVVWEVKVTILLGYPSDPLAFRKK